jgi:hypothetical protein
MRYEVGDLEPARMNGLSSPVRTLVPMSVATPAIPLAAIHPEGSHAES